MVEKKTLTSFKTSQIQAIDAAWILWFVATVCVAWCGTGH